MSHDAIRLKRSLSLLDAIMIGLGPTIGPTIFVVPRTAFDLAGSSSVLTLILAGIITLITAFNYAELSSRIPEAGGGYSFANKAFGGFKAFLAGWFMWIGSTAYIALSAITFAISLALFIPTISPSIIAILMIILFTILNFVGIKEAGRTQVLLTIFVTLVLFAFALLGLYRVDESKFIPFFSNGTLPMFTAIGYVYSVFVGFEIIANASEEVKRATIIVPRAILLTISIALILFPTILFVLIGIMPKEMLLNSQTPLIDASKFVFGPLGPTFMAIAALVASLASLNASVISSSRTLYALGRDRHLPSFLMKIHKRFRTPHMALAISMGLAIALVYFLQIDPLVYATDFGYILGLSIINASAIFLKREVADHRPIFKLPLHPLVPILATITTIAVIPTISIQALIIGTIITAVGFIVSYTYKKHSSPKN